jgi:hypothetical protein
MRVGLGDNASGVSSYGYNPDGTPDCTSAWSYVNPVLNAECLPGSAINAGGQVVSDIAAATVNQALNPTAGGSGLGNIAVIGMLGLGAFFLLEAYK